MTKSAGIHHITAIARDARRNHAFYTDDLGLRMVKKSVNQDDPGTYHLYYADETGSPGTVLTFFPWAHVAAGRHGSGQAEEVAFAIPKASLGYWMERLGARGIAFEQPATRFGDKVLAFKDPDGLMLELVAVEGSGALPGWDGGGVPAEHAIRGFFGVSLWLDDPEPTAAILTEVFGFARAGEEDGRVRYLAQGDGIGRIVDLRRTEGFWKGRMGGGTIHHVAFRAEDDAEEFAMREALVARGLNITEQIDRFYFRSMYFREPGGVIFELATDKPGFAVDEAAEALGQRLTLPPWLEPQRAEIENVLPALD